MKYINNLKKIHLALALVVAAFSTNAQTYVTVNNTCGFSQNGVAYKPLVCNYGISFERDWSVSPAHQYFLSPGRKYSASYGVPDTWSTTQGSWINYFNDYNNTVSHKVACQNKIISDLQKMKNLGFTEIRLIGAFMYTYDNYATLTYPCEDRTQYFALLDWFVQQADIIGLKITFLVGNGGEYNYNESFTNFLADVTDHYKTSTCITTWDLMNEPGNGLWVSSQNHKYDIAKMFSEWCNLVRSKDPNHLITVGVFADQWGQYAYDGNIMPIDYIS